MYAYRHFLQFEVTHIFKNNDKWIWKIITVSIKEENNVYVHFLTFTNSRYPLPRYTYDHPSKYKLTRNAIRKFPPPLPLLLPPPCETAIKELPSLLSGISREREMLVSLLRTPTIESESFPLKWEREAYIGHRYSRVLGLSILYHRLFIFKRPTEKQYKPKLQSQSISDIFFLH